jgi:NAD(P)H-dependent flavin oxidoreductase YrpB (nitropropane dioxygenase family)
MTSQNLLGSKYPIIAMAMNKVSNVRLAIAVRKAGAIPSLSVFNYFTPPDFNDGLLRDALTRYKAVIGDRNIFLSVSVTELVNKRFQKLLIEEQVRLIEIIPDTPGETASSQHRTDQLRQAIDHIRANGVLVFVKVLTLADVMVDIDGVILKGNDGAGRGTNNLEILFEKVRNKFIDLPIIVSGGIGTSEQVKWFIDRGALAVGIGTLFAASLESRVSYETKLKMVQATADSITKLGTGAVQNALVFSSTSNDSFNNTKGLIAGIKSPESGHIFAGTSVKHITDILPVDEIIQNLVKDL